MYQTVIVFAVAALLARDHVAAVLQLLPYPALLLLLMVLACSRILDKPGAQDPFAAAESERFKTR